MKLQNTLLARIQLIVIVALIALAFESYADEKNLLHEKNFPVAGGEKLKVEAPGADVYVASWDKNEVAIRTYGREALLEKLEFKYEKTEYGVLVSIKRKGDWISNAFDWGSNSLRIEVKAPKNFNTDLSTSGGDIAIVSLNGNLKMATSGGDIKVKDSYGELKGSTSGGDIDISGFEGPLKVSTSGGDIKVSSKNGEVNVSTSGGDIDLKVENGEITASSSGGDVGLTYKGENKGMNLTSTGGDIRLMVPQDFKADVHLTTAGGNIDCNLSMSKIQKTSKMKLDAELNGGGSRVKCTTTAGDIVIKGS